MTRTFYIKTMGCQMNEYDSDFLAQSLIRSGSSPVDDPGDADVILINTCTVRAKPEQKALSFLGRMIVIKNKKPDLILGITGCLAQSEGPNLMKRYPQLDLVMGPRELGRINEIIEEVNSSGERIAALGLETAPPRSTDCLGYFNGRVAASISIMEGCNNFCSYCIVPYVRGREISHAPEEIIAESKKLITEGVKEITLLGQNVNSYRREDGKACDFPSLLYELGRVKGLLRLRFTTSHPKDLSDELIRCFKDIDNLCAHIHLPFQAGSDRILQRMKRGYTRKRYMDLVAKLRESRPDIAITSDVMVGFPGESEADFDMTLDLIRQVQFDGLFSFKYSDRKGTLANDMDDKIDEAEKTSRLNTLQTLQKKITINKNRALEGRQVEVLVEGSSRRGGQVSGRSSSNKVVNFICKKAMLGELVNVMVKRGCRNSLQGECLP